MTDWAESVLKDANVRVAVIARRGHVLAKLVERSGMTHMAFVLKDPTTGAWTTVGLYSDPATGQKTALLWRQELADFYAEQPNQLKESEILIPKPEVQEALWRHLTADDWPTLLPAGHRYNLVAPVESPVSLNCTKWLALQMLAARTGETTLASLVSELPAVLHPPRIKAGPLLTWYLRRKPDVTWSELTPPGVIHTVTAESLKDSGWMTRVVDYPHPASALPRPPSP
ncbi:MAG: DUF2145 domain-containing protein [Candidatus Melainabacteria bacterium]